MTAKQDANGHATATAAGAPGGNRLLPVEARAVCYRMDNRPLIDHLDLSIRSAGISLIMGPNGAGKSLLLRLLHGLIEPDSGRIEWGGQALNDALRYRQALVFQKPVLLRRSVRKNLEFVLKLRRQPDIPRRCAELLDLVTLRPRQKQSARSLSGGEQQRLALARALAIDPQVLLLDEPTANLDPASTGMIEQLLRQQRQAGVKIIFVSHDLGQAKRLADDIIFMHRGRIVENTPAEVFFTRPATPAAAAYLAGELLI